MEKMRVVDVGVLDDARGGFWGVGGGSKTDESL